MRYTKIILIFLGLFIFGCGKSPLFNKLEKSVQEISGGILLSEYFPSQKIEFSLTWITPPDLELMGNIEIVLTSPLQASQTLNAYIWMPDMGHGSSPIEIKQINNTHYNFSEVAFIMPGLWILHIEILENYQVVDKWQKSIVL